MLVTGAVVAMALVWLTMFRGDAGEAPVVEAVQPPVVLPVPLPTETEPIKQAPETPIEPSTEAPIEPSTASPPRDPEIAESEAPPPDSAPIAVPESEPTTSAPTKTAKKSSKKSAAPTSYKAIVSGELNKRCAGKDVRECFVKHPRKDPVTLDVWIDPATGKATPEYSMKGSGIIKGSAPASCLDKVIATWTLPKGPGAPRLSLSCTLNKQR